jgi:hypothetical protein
MIHFNREAREARKVTSTKDIVIQVFDFPLRALCALCG